MSYLSFFSVCLGIVVSNIYCVLLCFCIVFRCLVYIMLLVSLVFPFLITPSVFSNVYLSCTSQQSRCLIPSVEILGAIQPNDLNWIAKIV